MLVWVRHVEGQRPHVARGRELGGGLAGLRLVAGGEDHREAPVGELPRHLAADPAVGAGHEGGRHVAEA